MVNDASECLAPAAALDQMGEALPRLIAAVAAAPHNAGIIVFAKLDIKDGFWRMCVSEEDAWNFAYALPSESDNIDEIEIVVPDFPCLFLPIRLFIMKKQNNKYSRILKSIKQFYLEF